MRQWLFEGAITGAAKTEAWAKMSFREGNGHATTCAGYRAVADTSEPNLVVPHQEASLTELHPRHADSAEAEKCTLLCWFFDTEVQTKAALGTLASVHRQRMVCNKRSTMIDKEYGRCTTDHGFIVDGFSMYSPQSNASRRQVWSVSSSTSPFMASLLHKEQKNPPCVAKARVG